MFVCQITHKSTNFNSMIGFIRHYKQLIFIWNPQNAPLNLGCQRIGQTSWTHLITKHFCSPPVATQQLDLKIYFKGNKSLTEERDQGLDCGNLMSDISR